MRSINSSLIHLLVFNNCFSLSSLIPPSILLSLSTSSGLPLCALPLDCSPSPDSLYVPGVRRGGVECIPCHWFCGGTDPTADMPRQTLCTSQVTSVFLVWFTCINFTTPLFPFFPLLLPTSFLPSFLPSLYSISPQIQVSTSDRPAGADHERGHLRHQSDQDVCLGVCLQKDCH